MNEAEFTKRFLDMEREVLALKTAHERALGNLKIYEETLSLPREGRVGFWDLIITSTFSATTPAFPLIKVLPGLNDTGRRDLVPVAQEYSGDGRTVINTIAWGYYSPAEQTTVSLLSTAPISSITYVWRNRL